MDLLNHTLALIGVVIIVAALLSEPRALVGGWDAWKAAGMPVEEKPEA